MRTALFRLSAALAPALLAAGCVAPGPFPSLAPRAAERDGSVEDPVRAPVPVAGDAALRARVAALLNEARSGEAAFDRAMAPAAAAAARAGGQGSESWIAAQQAVSVAEAARAPTVTALAELDALALARAGQPTNQEDYEALLAAVAEAQRLSGGQSARLDRLRAAISG
ncbi:MAG: hypothetical protein ACK4K7_15560 [Allosphingosinicella sp.]|uniref:hypothetical protein n=1 Tax=Allosphingosinicella sp. TaxID=2823234 RepID=UPI003945A347